MCSSGTILAQQLGRRVVAGVAAEPVLHGEFHAGIGQHLLDAGALDLAGGEGVADDCGILRQHGLDLARRELAPVQGAEIGELARHAVIAVAEIVLAAGVEGQLRRQHAAVPVEEVKQAAVVVEMPVTDDQRLDLGGVGADQLEVVQQRFGRVAKIEQHGVLLVRPLRFQQQRKAPLVVQGAAIIGARGGLDPDTLHLGRTQEQVV
jgi:hypothetical protein